MGVRAEEATRVSLIRAEASREAPKTRIRGFPDGLSDSGQILFESSVLGVLVFFRPASAPRAHLGWLGVWNENVSGFRAGSQPVGWGETDEIRVGASESESESESERGRRGERAREREREFEMIDGEGGESREGRMGI